MKLFLQTAASVLILAASAASADDTDIYLNPKVPSGTEPLVMFTLDYRSNLGATVCNGSECDSLIAGGYLPETGPYTFFQLLRAVLKKVLDPIEGVRVGFMLNHADSCGNKTGVGPSATGCSNGAYVLHGFTSMSAGEDDGTTYQLLGEDEAKVALFEKLENIPLPGGNVNHTFQGKELYFELFRYLTGQGIYNGHLGYKDFGDTTANTNLDEYLPAASWDETIENETNTSYLSPLISACAQVFVINLMFQVSSQEDDSDSAITLGRAYGGMGGINLSGKQNSFPTVIKYMHDADLADGTYGSVGTIDGKQNVISYFLVDPTKINTSTNEYAAAGGTASALPLSEDPEALIATLNNIFKSILSVSTTFVSPSVPVNVFNRSQILDEVFMALFKPDEDGFPRWNGNLKKLKIGTNTVTQELELQDAAGVNAIDIDGRIKRDSLTFWTVPATLPEPDEDEIAGVDGRAIARGGAGQQIAGVASGNPGASNTDFGARTMYTEDATDANDGLMSLNADAATASRLWTEITQNWETPASSSAYDSATDEERQASVNILRHLRGLTDDGISARNWLMGDPLHSRPRPINYGARGNGYDQDNPDVRVIMGTNAGVFHMFRNTAPDGSQDGSEQWAFAPLQTLRVIDRLWRNDARTPVHPNSVDGSPVVYTLDVNKDGALKHGDGDKVYAYFGLRRGGKSVYALDLSDPDNPKLLWVIDKGVAGSDFVQLGQSWSTPQVGQIKVDGNLHTVLVFAGGYNGDDDGDDLGDLGKDAKNRATRAGTTAALGDDDDEGNAIFVVDALSGALIWKAVKGATNAYDNTARAFEHPDLLDSFPAQAVAVDTSGNGLLDRIYAGDTGGVLWRIDLAGLVDHDNDPDTPAVLTVDDRSVWTLTPILSVGRHMADVVTTNNDRRFFNRVDVARSRDHLGPFDAVILGTGDREDPNGDTVDNYFYVLKDRAVTSGLSSPALVKHGDLGDVTDNCLQDLSCTTSPNLDNGWRLSLTATGEKNLAGAVTLFGKLFFTTFAPSHSSSSCSIQEGEGRLYALNLSDATAVMNFDTSNDVSGVTRERVDMLESGGIPVEPVPLNEGILLIQGQRGGQNLVPTGAPSGLKTYWHNLHR